MRVHRLEMTAFGPFADTQVVDFGPLNAAGVFLLTGQTGAGKTSVLDAVCFGLYGQVPGDRDKAKAYHSHHAADGIAPRVVLEVTLQGRRFRLTRSPAWHRRSTRAKTGYVDEKAKATAEELVGRRWQVRSTRVDEVGHLVSRLLGLNKEQFCQVVLLPQGDFAAFLRADGRTRQRILESLFATQRFQAVERWLTDHRRELGRDCRDRHERVGRLLARVEEVWPEETGAAPVAIQEVRRTAESVRRCAATAAARAAESQSLAKLARHAFDEARTLADRQARYRAAEQGRDSLLATADLNRAREEAVRRARAAAALTPLLSVARSSRADHARASERLHLATAQCSDLLDLTEDPAGPTAVTVEAAAARLADRLAAVAALRDVEARCDRLTADARGLTEEQSHVESRICALDAEIAADPAVLADARTRLAAVEQAAADEARAEAAVEACERVLEAAKGAARLDLRRDDLDARRHRAREAAVQARERWLDARERYLAGMAADLAAVLRDGDPCPVCGSADHPAPAAPSPEHVSRQDETDLLAAASAASEELERLERERLALERERASALTASGGVAVAAAEAAAAEARDSRRVVREAAAAQARLLEEVAALEVAAERRRVDRALAAEELATVTERLSQTRARLDSERQRLVTEIGPDARVAPILADLTGQGEACRTLVQAVHAEEAAAHASSQAESRFVEALADSEFDSVEDLLGAALGPSAIANAEALIRAHAGDLAAVHRVLSDAALAAAAALPAPDLPTLESRAEQAAGEAAETARVAADLERRQARLESLQAELEAEDAKLGPLLAAKQVADDVAGLCTGTSPDNATRTALSHYVLGARLVQVVDAANVRLGSICGGRYRLLHTTAREAGQTRGGLGLLVSDLHTDQLRDPVTLSGGETFYVSLSLALGLADVVSHEAGGAELSTLFVDEGFGGLDDVTRDEVLDELDALRSGGRTVGLVSHLAELRARFPAQVRIFATPNGSKCLTAADHEAEWTGDEC